MRFQILIDLDILHPGQRVGGSNIGKNKQELWIVWQFVVFYKLVGKRPNDKKQVQVGKMWYKLGEPYLSYVLHGKETL